MKVSEVKKLLFTLIFIIFTSPVVIFSADTQTEVNKLKGFQLSSYLSDFFSNEGFSTTKENLTKTDTNSFPYNILINIDKTASEESVSPINTLIIAVTQEYTLKHLESVNTLLHLIQRKKADFNIIFAITACDIELNFSADEKVHTIMGTTKLAENYKELDNYCAFIIEDSASSDSYTMIPGGNGDISPYWLLESLYKAFTRSNKIIKYPGSFIFLYRNHLVEENKRISSFFANGIPSIGLTLQLSDTDIEDILGFIDNLGNISSTSWDRHYIFLPQGKNTYTIKESDLIVIFLFFAALVLLSLSFFSFSNSPKSKAVRKDIGRNWFILFIYLFVTTAFLILGQSIACNFSDTSLDILSIKIIIAMIIMFLLIFTQVRFNFRISFQSLGYETLFVMAANVFVFTSIDLSLMFLFFFEYIIAFLFRKVKKIWSLVIFTIILYVPFFPYITTLLDYSNLSMLYPAVKCGYTGNLLTALIILPLEMQWTRILIKYEGYIQYEKKSKKRKVIYSIIFIIVSSVILTFVLQVSDLILKSTNSNTDDGISLIDLNQKMEEDFISCRTDSDDFMELSIKSLTITTSAQVVRYDIIINSINGSSIYDCNYDYELLSDGKAEITLPSYPPYNLDIIFTTDYNSQNEIAINAYVQNNDGSFSYQQKTVTL